MSRMPIDVDIDARLTDIARATLEVIRVRGTAGLTIRAVADALGGSTTLVTNYLPNRAALLRNAMRIALDEWEAELDAHLADVPERERLEAAAHWATTTTGDDHVLRRLFLETIAHAEADTELHAALRDDARQTREYLAQEADRAQARDPQFVADALHLLLRGYYLSSLEDPESWPPEQMAALLTRIIASLIPVEPQE